MADQGNGNGNRHDPRERNRTLRRRWFLKHGLAFAGCSAAGVLLDACSLTTSPPAVPSATPRASATPPPPPSPPASAAPSAAATLGPADIPGGGVVPEAPSPNAESAALAEPFTGITTDGTPIPDLYPLSVTGRVTEPLRVAAEAFLAALTPEQRAVTLFAVDDLEWRKWSDADEYQRQGLSLDAMSPELRTAAMNLLAAALSAKGFETAQTIMKLNRTLGEMTTELDRFNERLYWFTVMGRPSATEPWGFQVDGHHLVINVFVLGDQVVMAPVFLGAEPPVATRGIYSGLRVLQREQDQGLALMRSLSADQRRVALLDARKQSADLLAGAFRDNAVVPARGISYDALTPEQQAQLVALISEWVGNLRDEHAATKLDEVRRHLATTTFAWIGETSADAVFYYQIQSPVLLIEFDHEAPGPLADNPDYFTYAATRLHVHGVLRSPNGNDYGMALLRQSQAARPRGSSQARPPVLPR